MRVAVPSDDQRSIAPHFGRAEGFLLFDVLGTTVQAAGYRRTDSLADACACSSAQRSTRHERVLDALAGCSTVIANGMGAHMYDDLAACGLRVVLTDMADARAAVNLLASGALAERGELGCH
jgi:predicted Fe-Mo cluster-binding NifX family protein